MIYTSLIITIKLISYFLNLLIYFYQCLAITALFITLEKNTPKIKKSLKIRATIILISLAFITPAFLKLPFLTTTLLICIYIREVKNINDLQIFILDTFIWATNILAFFYSRFYVPPQLRIKVVYIIKLTLISLFLTLSMLFVRFKLIIFSLFILSTLLFCMGRSISVLIYTSSFKENNTYSTQIYSPFQLINTRKNTHPVKAPIDERIFDEIINIDDPYLVYPVFFKSKSNLSPYNKEEERLQIWNIVRWNSALSKPSGFIQCPPFLDKEKSIINLYITFIPVFSDSVWRDINKLGLPTRDLISQPPFWSPFIIAETKYKWPKDLCTYERLNEIEEEDCQCSLNRTSSLHLERRTLPHCQPVFGDSIINKWPNSIFSKNFISPGNYTPLMVIPRH